MSRTIDFYFDFPSPYAYLAHTQLPGIAAAHGATISYRPFRILELMKIVGNRPTTIECKNEAGLVGNGDERAGDFHRRARQYDFSNATQWECSPGFSEAPHRTSGAIAARTRADHGVCVPEYVDGAGRFAPMTRECSAERGSLVVSPICRKTVIG